jgi:U4/U6.U5 tri-snRNP-associated protein 1
VRNKHELHASLKGATLGDIDGETDDTLKWVKKSKKKEKELAKKRQEEIESMDKVFRGDEYTEGSRFRIVLMSHVTYADFILCLDDLVGLKVAHDFEELGEGEDRVLTLKDSRILDNEGTLFLFILTHVC